MGTRTLEASLRRRLVLLVGPVTLGVGVAAVAVTSHMLDAADRGAARSRAAELLLRLKEELAEGDAPSVAADEVLGSRDDSWRALVRGQGIAGVRASAGSIPGRLGELTPGDCGASNDEAGHPWIACSVERDGFEAVVALSVDAHRRIVQALAESMLAIVVLAILAAIGAARFAVGAPLAALGRLVQWSEGLARGQAPPAPRDSDIAEIQRLTKSLDALVQHLTEALERERTTSAHIAHELRTPLTTLRAELETLDPRGNDVRGMLADVDQLARVIDSILVLSVPVETSSKGTVVNLADLVRDLVTDETRVEAPEEALVEGDAHLAELALRNLLDNAKKYGGAPARVVRITRAQGGIRVAVIDDGPGIEDEARARMFERHWRRGEGEGTGLGLALVRAVAERHGGAVEALRNESGKGLEVSMTFGRALGWHP